MIVELLAFLAVAYLFPIPTALAFALLGAILGLGWVYDTVAAIWRRLKGAP